MKLLLCLCSSINGKLGKCLTIYKQSQEHSSEVYKIKRHTNKEVKHDVSNDDVEAAEVDKGGGNISAVCIPVMLRSCTSGRLNLRES